MAAKIPEKLKPADVQRFATRAAQLEKFRPIVSYWCEYYILQQVLNRGLHAADQECTEYATTLMDKLEQTKTANASNDAILDDVAAKAYMENFALETFGRADSAQRENKVTRQTADTFQAAATFMDVLTIWGPLDAELAAKSKFAKFHALRIARALKAGEDPNATNPEVQPLPAPSAEDDVDAEMKDLEASEQRRGSTYEKPSVESAPDSMQPSRSESAAVGQPWPPPELPTSTPYEAGPASAQQRGDVSPIEPDDAVNSRHGSIGGGYFPSAPSDADQPGATRDASLLTQPVAPQPPSVASPGEFYSAAHSPSAPIPPPSANAPVNMQQSPITPRAPNVSTFHPPPPAQIGSYAPTPQSQAPPPAPVPSNLPAPPIGGYRTDDESTMEAQKHAKWAISALNFEDVPTAVKELRLALQMLGAH